MSVQAMARVWELDLPHAERLILLALADHADQVGDYIYPSIGLIAWKTGYSDRQVQRVMQALVKKKVLRVQKQGGGRGNPTIYRFDLTAGKVKEKYVSEFDRIKGDTMSPIDAKGDIASPFGGPETVTSATSKGDIYDVKGDIAMSPEPTNRQRTNDVAAAMKSVGMTSKQQRDILTAQPDLTVDEVMAWQPFHESPPRWCDKPEGYIYRRLIDLDAPPAAAATPEPAQEITFDEVTGRPIVSDAMRARLRAEASTPRAYHG